MEKTIFDLIMENMDPRLLLLVLFVYVTGFLLKKWKKFKDENIIPVLWGLAILYTILWYGVITSQGLLAAETWIQGTIQGTLIMAASVLANQFWKQKLEKK